MVAQNLTSLRILAVDDNEDDHLHYERLLSRTNNPTELFQASNRDEAFACLENEQIDCILLDYFLLGDDGVSILTQISEKYPFIAVIMLTGQGSEDVAAASLKLGASDYITKSKISSDMLMRCITNAVQKSKLNEKLAEQQANQRQFLDTLIHDMKAPLIQIDSVARIMGAAINDGEFDELPDFQQLISRSTRRALHLIETLEAYAFKDGINTFEPVKLNDTASDALANLSSLVSTRNAKIDVAALPTIQGHAPQLIQVFQNLISNGIKYNKSSIPEIAIASSLNSQGDALLEVRDNGIGIDKEFLEKVFKPFERLNHFEDVEGSGLGLAICQKAVSRHSGEIWCSSVPSKGTTFFLKFPKDVVVK